MDEEVDEYGVAKAKADVENRETDEYGVPIVKKKEETNQYREAFGPDSTRSSDPILNHIKSNAAAPIAEKKSESTSGNEPNSVNEQLRTVAENKHRVADAFAQSYKGKYPKQYSVAPEFSEQLGDFIAKETKSGGEIAQKQLDTWSSARSKELADSGMSKDDIDAIVQIEGNDKAKSINEFQNSVLQHSYEGKLDELHKLTAEKEDAKRVAEMHDTGFFDALGRKFNDVFLNQLPKDLYLNHMMQLPASYDAARKDLEWAGRIDGLDFKQPIDKLIDIYGKAKQPDAWQNLFWTAIAPLRGDKAFNSKDIPERLREVVIHNALVETKKELGDASGDPELARQTFAEKFNRSVEKQKAKEWQSATEQGDQSEKYLKDIPSTWEDAKLAQNRWAYVAGAAGNAAGTSAVAAIGGIPGAGVAVAGMYAMEAGEAYDTYVKAKAASLTERYGTTVTPEQIVLAGEDKEAVELAHNVGMVNAGLESVGMFFGVGKLAINVFSKKLVTQAVKKGLGKQLVAFGKGLGTATVAEGGTETLQSINTIIGKKMIDGKSIDEAIASFDEKEVNEVLESARQGAIGGVAFGGAAATSEATSQVRTNKNVEIAQNLLNTTIVTPELKKTLDSLEKSGDVKKKGDTVEVISEKGAIDIYNHIAADRKVKAEETAKSNEQEISTANSFVNSALPGLKGIPKMRLQKQLDALVESGDVKRVENVYEAQTPEAARVLNEQVSNMAGYLPRYHPVRKLTAEYQAAHPSIAPQREGEMPTNSHIEGLSLNLERVAQSGTPMARAAKSLINVKKAISRIAPDTRVLFFENDEAGVKALRALGYDVQDGQQMNGFHDAKNRIIAINTSEQQSNTTFHEGIHPVINLLQEKNPEVFESFAKQAASVAHPDGKTYGEVMGSDEEALVELLADVADGKFDKKTTVAQHVVKFINTVLEKIGVAPIGVTPDQSTLQAYANDIAFAIHQGRPINTNKKAKKVRKPQMQNRLYKEDGSRKHTKGQTDAIENIVSENPVYKPLFNWHQNRGGKIRFFGGRGDNEGIANYNKDSDEIKINVNHSKFDEFYSEQDTVDRTVAHEIIHRVIHEKLGDKSIRKKFDSELSGLRDILSQHKSEDDHVKKIIKHIHDGSPEEMVTYALTDKSVAEFMNTIKVPGEASKSETVWTKIKDLILGIVGNKDQTLLDAVTRVMDDYVGDIEIKPRKPQYQDRKIEKGNRLFSEPLADAKRLADIYAEQHGMPENRGENIKKINVERAKQIATAYDKMKDDPTNPEVQASYEAMANETLAQHKLIVDNGYTVTINNDEPYSNSADMIEDLRANKRMRIFSTEAGFGDVPITPKQREENPLLRDSGFKDSAGQTLLVNDVFRFVHDFFGHAERGNSFGPLGEENAWDNHSRMYTPLARRAMTTETRGQNSYVNYSGVNDEAFEIRDKARKLRAAGKVEEAAEMTTKVYQMVKFAEQKTGLLPEEFSKTDDELAGDLRVEETPEGPVFNVTIPDVKFQTTGRINNLETKVKRAPLSDFAGKRVTIIPSDRLTTGNVATPNSDKVHQKFGGIYYPAATGNVWASSTQISADKITNNLEFDKDGNAYIGIMAMGKDSHMSNYNSVIYSLDAIEGSVRLGKAKTSEAIEKINQALATSINSDRWGQEASFKNFSIPKSASISEAVKRVKKFFSVENNSFSIRRPFLESLLGNSLAAGKKTLWGDVPTFSEMSKRLQDPTLADVPFGSLVAMMRISGKPKTEKTSASNKNNHESYPYAIKAPKMEFYLLDGAYRVSDVVPEINLRSGDKLEWTNYVDKYGEDQGLRNYVRQINLSPRTETISDAKKKVDLKLQDRKVNNTAKRVANDANTQYKDIQARILKDPDAYSYDTQSIKDRQAELGSMPLQELTAAQSITDLNNALSRNTDFSVLAAIELLKRHNAAGDFNAANDVFLALKQSGTSIGQLLRQFGELKTTPEGIKNAVEGNLKSMGLFLTDPHKKELEKLTQDYNRISSSRNLARTNYISNPTAFTHAKLELLNNQAADAFQKLGAFVGKVTPMGIERMLLTILQGNLLVPKSVVTNVVGNVVNPTKYVERWAGSLSAYAVNRITGKNPVSAIEMFWGNTLNSVVAFGKALYTGPKEAITGRKASHELLDALEVRNNLSPLTAVRQLFSKGSLPVGADGKVPLWLKTEKAIEATLGINPNIMFRLLEVGDKPFRESAKLAALYKVYAENGGSSKYHSFDVFRNSMSAEQSKRVDKMTNEVIFSDEGELYKNVNKYLVPLLNDAIPAMANQMPVIGPMMEIASRVMMKTVLPYVKIPSNLLQRSIEYAFPIVPAMRAVNAYRRGDHRTGGEMVARMMLGATMWYVLDAMYAAGVIVAGSADDDKEVRALKYESSGMNTVNLTGLMRLISGTQDPANPAQEGDEYVDFSRLGILGIIGSIRSEVNENLAKNPDSGLKHISEHPMNWLGAQFNGMIKGSLDISFLQQSMNMFEEFGKNGVTGITTEMLGSASAILLPNNMMVFTKSKAPYALRATDEDVLTELQEKMSVKMFPNQADGVTTVYPIIGMFGTPVKATPDNKNAFVYQFFDISKSRTLDDPLVVELLNMYSGDDRLKPEQLPISAPTPDIDLPVSKTTGQFTESDEDGELKKFTASEQDWVYMQMLAGQFKKFMINQVKDSGEWDPETDLSKNKILSVINQRANKAAKAYIQNQVFEALQNGRVTIVDGRYQYVNKPAFDYEYYEKNQGLFEESNDTP